MLFIAVLIPAISPLLFFLSSGLVIAAFVMAIMTIAKGRFITGALLIAACPLAMMAAWGAIGAIAEGRRELARREAATADAPTRRSEPPPVRAAAPPEFVTLTMDTTVYTPELESVAIAAGTRLKVITQQRHDVLFEYEGRQYTLPTAVTRREQK